MSCWWISTLQAVKPFVGLAKLKTCKYQGSDTFLWRGFIDIFEMLSTDISRPIPFRVIQPLVEDSARKMNMRCNEQQDVAEFYLQLMVPFLGESCLTHEIEICKSLMCLNCENNSIVESSTFGILSVAVHTLSIVNCLQEFFKDEVISGLRCDECGKTQCKKTIFTRIITCPKLLVVQLLRFGAVDEQLVKLNSDISPTMEIDLSKFCTFSLGITQLF